jgi:hypothetical protein
MVQRKFFWECGALKYPIKKFDRRSLDWLQPSRSQTQLRVIKPIVTAFDQNEPRLRGGTPSLSRAGGNANPKDPNPR